MVDKETNSFNGMIGMVQRKVEKLVKKTRIKNVSIIFATGSKYGNG